MKKIHLDKSVWLNKLACQILSDGKKLLLKLNFCVSNENCIYNIIIRSNSYSLLIITATVGLTARGLSPSIIGSLWRRKWLSGDFLNLLRSSSAHLEGFGEITLW